MYGLDRRTVRALPYAVFCMIAVVFSNSLIAPVISRLWARFAGVSQGKGSLEATISIHRASYKLRLELLDTPEFTDT
jgi:hypothetical protein